MVTDHPPFQYRFARPTAGVFPGAHPGQMLGSGQLFKHHLPLIASPDPRRIDLRASLLDPFSHYQVRSYQQQNNLDVYIIADMSASMAYRGRFDKRRTLIRFVLATAESAFAYGDNFGFIGCRNEVDQRNLLPACSQRSRVQNLAQTLQRVPFEGEGAALASAAYHLPARGSLVFLFSDAHLPLTRLRHVLHTLRKHQVVPVIIWDLRELADFPQRGLVCYRDMETGAQRTLWMRPALRRQITAAYHQRRQAIRQTCLACGVLPLFHTGTYDADVFTRFFQQYAL